MRGVGNAAFSAWVAREAVVQRQTGLAEETSVTKYAGRAKDLFENWDKKTPAVRLRNVAGAANLELVRQKVTALKGVETPLASEGDAVFDFMLWQIGIDPRILQRSAVPTEVAATLADKIYHEARHAEQWFRIARLKAGEGRTKAQLVTDLLIPEHVARDAAANPLRPLTAAQQAALRPEVAAKHAATVAEAGDWHESIYGAGAAHRNAVLGDIQNRYAEYRALAEEVDAWAVGALAAQVLRGLLTT